MRRIASQVAKKLFDKYEKKLAADSVNETLRRVFDGEPPKPSYTYSREDLEITVEFDPKIAQAEVDLGSSVSPELEATEQGNLRGGASGGISGAMEGAGSFEITADGEIKGIDIELGTQDLDFAVHIEECEESLTIYGPFINVTLARNTCEDEEEEDEEDEDEEGEDDEDDGPPPPEFGGPPPGYTGWICPVRDMRRVTGSAGYALYAPDEASFNEFAASEEPMDRPNWSSEGFFFTDYRIYYVNRFLGMAPWGVVWDLEQFPTYGSRNTRTYFFRQTLTGASDQPFWAQTDRGWRELNHPRIVLLDEEGEYVDHRHVQAKATRYLINQAHPILGSCEFVTNYQPEPPPSPPPENAMEREKCCEEATKMMREIHQALGVRKLLDSQFSVPANMLVPEGEGYHKNADYLEILSDVFKAIDNYGFDAPVTAYLQDSNKAQKGDQEVEIRFNSLAAILKANTEMLLELKGDSANRLNLQVRLAYMVTRMYRTVTKMYYKVQAILDFIGAPLQYDKIKIPLEFNIFGKKSWRGKGFDPNAGVQDESAIDLNDEDTTESMLPDLLDLREYEIEVEELRPRVPDLRDLLMRIVGTRGK